MKKSNLVILLVLTISINLVAQENTSLQTRKAQITFAYPIGSNGIEAPNYSNNFSFNILYGLNGGVNSFELGSILNYNKGEVFGFQLAGISNLTTDNSKGFSLSGVANICNGETGGVGISGILNYSKQMSVGFQLSGVSNVCSDSTSGFFLSGVLNYSNQNSKGFQMATINVTADKVTGFQLGVVNYAKELNGIQLGIVNILKDNGKGLPIGIFSLVKNGFFEFELTGGEVIYSNLNYKMGVERFYTIFKAGNSTYNNPVYSYGIGFGSNISISEKNKINIDLSGNSIVYNNNWDSDLNLLNKADFNYKYRVTEKLSLLIGPSFNVYIAKEKVGDGYGTLNIPYTIYKSEWTSGKLSMWIGFNAGLSFKI